MDRGYDTTVARQDEQALIKELAAIVVGRTAPEELVLFEETAQEYFDDPKGVLQASGRDEAVGFGLDVAMWTPYVLATVGPVITFLVTTVADSARDELKSRTATLVRGLFRRPTGPATGQPPAGPALTPDQAARVREITRQRAVSLGLPEPTAALLADSVVGGIIVNG